MTPVNDNHEIRHAEKTIALVKQCIEKELTHLKLRRENILEERKYFNDYFNELKEDEKKDLLDNELLDLLKANISTLNPKFNKKSIHSTPKSSKCFLDSSHMKTKSISSPLKAKNGLKELKLSLFKFILLIIDSSWSLENLENMEFTLPF